MLVLAILAAGLAVGGLAQLLLGRARRQIDWTLALFAGILGSFIGGTVFSLVAGDGFAIAPSGLIGSLGGAIVLTLARQAHTKRVRARERAEAERKPWEK